MQANLTNEKKEHIIELLQNDVQTLTVKLSNAKDIIQEYEKICVYFEDKYTQMYKIAYLKLNDFECNEENLDDIFKEKAPFVIFGKNGKEELRKFLDQASINEHDCKKIVGVFDFDDAYSDFNGLCSERWNAITGTEQTGLFRVRKDHSYFTSVMLPVPPHRQNSASRTFANNSRLTSELLFEDEILKRLNVWREEDIPRTNPPQKETVFSGNKSTFWKTLFSLEKSAFIHFKPLFDIIIELSNREDAST